MPALSELRDRFLAQMTKLAENGDNIANSTKDQAVQRLWQIPDKGKGESAWDEDIQNLTGISKAFDRDKNSQDVIDAYIKQGVVGDTTAGSMQGDILAALERAYRARIQSSVRAIFHAAARRGGHGHTNGPIMGGIVGRLGSILEIAKASEKKDKTT